MRYLQDHPLRRDHRELSLRIETAARRLHEKLEKLDPEGLSISAYNQRYLGKMLAKPLRILRRLSYLLFLALEGSPRPMKEFTLVDYGGGCGMLSFLAGEVGVGRVIYNDIYDVSCKDAAWLAGVLGARVKEYVCGDIADLLLHLRKNALSVDALLSNDVIEHVYDIQGYLAKMASLSDRPFRVVHATDANGKNPLVAWRLRKTHLACEYQNRAVTGGWKQRDSLRSYVEVRKEIIAHHAPALASEEVKKLATLTRGMNREDIVKTIDEYLQKGGIAYRPDHPTNTCDPHTGNWAEHLMDIGSLEAILRKDGFTVRTLSGYWHHFKPLHMRMAGNLLDFIIRAFQRKALCISPYYVICAERRP